MIHAILLIAALLLVTLAVDAGHGYRLGTFLRWVKYRLTPETRPAEPEPAPDPEPAPEINVPVQPSEAEPQGQNLDAALLVEYGRMREAAEYWHELAERTVAEYLALEQKVLQAQECPVPEHATNQEELAN